MKAKHYCGYDIQSAHSMVGKESYNKMALKRCTNTEIRWCRKLTSIDSPVLREILLPISFDMLVIIIMNYCANTYAGIDVPVSRSRSSHSR